ncbi:tetratricopeptide repeat protein [Geoalkalibacter halelectricus]|uniref:Tetratricopeptide repeat protein n=1 Tax=Geoalkalibacter halelectricus TaxID=2847045 RepID=A0ABY5ZS77_9BACT|nr:tetratricopeptide repeat protein [Geoalkalibacter halelectricus]MDO3379934.1 tetratricopeptide repeat protein [Geoalkalibacter halelectricus]UWZ80539.1 tetratricopeptide repeat protein [Geoalkalibacter halelectricus]
MVFSRLFGRKTPLEQMRRARDDARWADVLQFSENVRPEELSTADREAFESLLQVAGDQLAQLNLEEGEGCARAGETVKAREHFELALSQVRDDVLRKAIEAALTGLAAPAKPASSPGPGGAVHCGTGGGSTGRTAAPVGEDAEFLDEASRFELTLASYPAELAERYLDVSDAFRRAFLATHDGRDAQALELYAQVPEAERSDLYYFERGSLAARSGDSAAAQRDLRRALELNPSHVPALEALIALALGAGRLDEARDHALRGLESGSAPSFCLSRLAIIHTRQGDYDQALDYARQALDAGPADPDILLLTSSLLERRGELGEAERLLARMSGGGCKGGASAHLAEFWLRHGRNLEKALDAFNQAARQEPGNPRWRLRIGETYLARGWKKEGRALVEEALGHPGLSPDLRAAAEKILSVS